MFYIYSGDLMGLTTNDNYINFRWNKKDCKVLFSVCKRGDAANCHIASDKRGLRHLKQACNDFFDFVMSEFKWCKHVIVAVTKKSVCRMIEKIGFELLGSADDSFLYIRVK
tara:strand:- start:238 stop:570 length:333 start_codon:yes stop_codon:yes gene_type:complete